MKTLKLVKPSHHLFYLVAIIMLLALTSFIAMAANVEVIDVEAPDGIGVGETRSVEVQVKNLGKRTQTRSLSLTLNGVPVSGSPVSVTLTKHDNKVVKFNVLFATPGIATLTASLSPHGANSANDTKTEIKVVAPAR